MFRCKAVIMVLLVVPVITLGLVGCKTGEGINRKVVGNRGYLVGAPSLAAEESVPREEVETCEESTEGEILAAAEVPATPPVERAGREITGNRGYLFGGPSAAEEAVRGEEIETSEECAGEPAEAEILTVAEAPAAPVESEELQADTGPVGDRAKREALEVVKMRAAERLEEEEVQAGEGALEQPAESETTEVEEVLVAANEPAEEKAGVPNDPATEETTAETGVEEVLVAAANEPVEEKAGVSGEGEEPAVTEETSGKVTMDFKDADIHNVLRILAYKGNVNIIAGPEVAGTVTIRLTDVPWEKALGVVLRTYGFAYEREANIIRITTLDKLKEEELITEVFSLNYGKAEEIVESVKEMVTARGRVKHDARTNLLIVTDVPTNTYQIGQVIRRLDKRTPQVLIEAKVVETTLGDKDELGVDWTLLVQAGGASRPINFPFNRNGTPFHKGEKYYPLGDTDDSVGFPTSTIPAFPYVGSDSFTFGKLDFAQFKAVMEALKSRTDTNIISNPRITTLNNQEAKILVGTEIGIPIYERVEGTVSASMEITGYEYREVGIKLLVTPHINENGDIVLDLHPSVTEQLDYDQLTAEIRVPKFSTREAETQVMIRDGETIVIGGLIKDKVIDRKTKVPLLGDIPLLGYFFSKKEQTIEKIDLMFFVTAHIITDEDLISGTVKR